MADQLDASNEKKGAVITDLNTVALLLMVVFVTMSSQYIFASIPGFADKEPVAFMALLAGAIISMVMYIPVKYLFSGSRNMTDSDAMGVSVLMGLISSYFMIFRIEAAFPDIQSIALTVFLFYYHFDRSLQRT
jgi:hypothetical protein